MKITKEERENQLIVKVEGWLDIQSNQEFAAYMGEIPVQEKLVLDLQGLEYISSSGVREIVGIILRQPKGSFSIINVNENVMSVFKIIGLDEKIEIKPAV